VDRDTAVDRVEELVETVASEELPVPVREVWVYGEVALGLDPVERLDVYVTKDILLGDDAGDGSALDRELGVEGVGQTVRASWAADHPEFVRANESGHVAPERCLAAHLLDDGEPIHLEVCNTSFEDNVTQRLEGVRAREDYAQLLDPRGACLWLDGQRSAEAFRRLREGEFAFPTLAGALEMLGMDDEAAETAAEELRSHREARDGTTVRGDVV
jgi:hypothetical protein